MIIIAPGEDVWLLSYINKNRDLRTIRVYPLTMSIEEVKMAWLNEALSGTMVIDINE